MVGVYCVNQLIRFTNGALNAVNFHHFLFVCFIQCHMQCGSFPLKIHTVPAVIDRVQLHYAVHLDGPIMAMNA